jgi:hypothetical protein
MQILALADELAAGAIERALSKSDAELGLEYLLRSGTLRPSTLGAGGRAGWPPRELEPTDELGFARRRAMGCRLGRGGDGPSGSWAPVG